MARDTAPSVSLIEGPKWCDHRGGYGVDTLGPTCRCDHWSCFADATRWIVEHGTAFHFCDAHERTGGADA